MTEIWNSIPAGCVGYVVFFMIGLFFPQVKLADLAAAFMRGKSTTDSK